MPDNLGLDRKLKVLSFMEFLNYDYHAENMKLSAGKCPLPDLEISFIYPTFAVSDESERP